MTVGGREPAGPDEPSWSPVPGPAAPPWPPPTPDLPDGSYRFEPAGWASPSGRPATAAAFPGSPYPTPPGYLPTYPPSYPAYGPNGLTPYGPTGPPAYLAPRPKKSHRRLFIGLASGLVLLVGALTAVGVGVSRSRQDFADGQHRVTVWVPLSWDGGTDPDATDGPPTDDEIADEYEIENLAVTSFFNDQSVYVYIDDTRAHLEADEPLGSVQAHSAEDECDYWSCFSRGGATPLTVDGQPGFEQVLNAYDDDSEEWLVEVIQTVQTPTMTVRAIGSVRSDTEHPDPQPVRDILHSMTFAG